MKIRRFGETLRDTRSAGQGPLIGTYPRGPRVMVALRDQRWGAPPALPFLMKVPHPVPPLLAAWLRARDQAELVDSGLHPLAIFGIAANKAGPGGLPVPVLEEWSYAVRVERLMIGQSATRLLPQLRQAGLADDAITAAMGLDETRSLDEHAVVLEQERTRARQHHIDMSQHYADVLSAARATGEYES